MIFTSACTISFATLQLWHFRVGRELFKAFPQQKTKLHFLSLFQSLESYDTHPVKAKAFVAFEMPRPTTNFIWLWGESLLLFAVWKNPFQSASRLHQHQSGKFHSSDFLSACQCIGSASRQCEGSSSTYPSPACAFTTTSSGWFLFWISFRKGLSMFMCSLSLRFRHPTARTSLPYFFLSMNFDRKLSTLLPAFLRIFRKKGKLCTTLDGGNVNELFYF